MKSEIHITHPPEALQQQTGSDDQHQSYGNLRRNKTKMNEYPRTRQSTTICPTPGILVEISRESKSRAQTARSMPSRPLTLARTRLSVNIWRNSRTRPAPKA